MRGQQFLTAANKMYLKAQLQVQFAELAARNSDESVNVSLHRDGDDDQRKKLIRGNEGKGELDIWGTVVDASTADYLPRNALFSLGDAGEKGPPMYVDGSRYVNLERDDACWGCIVPPVPKRKREAAVGEGKPKKPKSKAIHPSKGLH